MNIYLLNQNLGEQTCVAVNTLPSIWNCPRPFAVLCPGFASQIWLQISLPKYDSVIQQFDFTSRSPFKRKAIFPNFFFFFNSKAHQDTAL